MTIHNIDKFMSTLWDWGILSGCFGETKIRPTDVDGMVERNGHFLFLEAKSTGVTLPKGQQIMFSRLAAPKSFTVFVVHGDTNQPQRLTVFHNGAWQQDRECDLQGFRRAVSRWWEMANTDHLVIVPSPVGAA